MPWPSGRTFTPASETLTSSPGWKNAPCPWNRDAGHHRSRDVSLWVRAWEARTSLRVGICPPPGETVKVCRSTRPATEPGRDVQRIRLAGVDVGVEVNSDPQADPETDRRGYPGPPPPGRREARRRETDSV